MKIATMFFLSTFAVSAFGFQEADSTKASKPLRFRIPDFTTRLYSIGYFPYTGQLGNNNPAIDFTLTYNTKPLNVLVYKIFDLYDHRTSNNYSLVMLYRDFRLGKRLTISPYFGALLYQTQKFADRGSDALLLLTTTLKLNNHFSIDNSLVLTSILLERSATDWTNRFRFLYSNNHLDLTLLCWLNNKVFDTSDYFSTGINISFSRVSVSKHCDLSTGLTGLVTVQSSDQVINPKKNGLLFIVGLTIH